MLLSRLESYFAINAYEARHRMSLHIFECHRLPEIFSRDAAPVHENSAAQIALAMHNLRHTLREL